MSDKLHAASADRLDLTATCSRLGRKTVLRVFSYSSTYSAMHNAICSVYTRNAPTVGGKRTYSGVHWLSSALKSSEGIQSALSSDLEAMPSHSLGVPKKCVCDPQKSRASRFPFLGTPEEVLLRSSGLLK